jgi:hypothetical protein
MSNPRFSLEEFNALFPGKFESREEMLKEYDSFLTVLQQLDRAPVPELSARDRAEIFRRSWPEQSYSTPSVWAWLAFWRRPAVTFALGLVLGCALMLAFMRDQPQVTESTPVRQPLKVERTRHMQVYEGAVLQELYPHIESPKMIVEKTQESSRPRRVLRGTLGNGNVYVVWNLQ